MIHWIGQCQSRSAEYTGSETFSEGVHSTCLVEPSPVPSASVPTSAGWQGGYNCRRQCRPSLPCPTGFASPHRCCLPPPLLPPPTAAASPNSWCLPPPLVPPIAGAASPLAAESFRAGYSPSASASPHKKCPRLTQLIRLTASGSRYLRWCSPLSHASTAAGGSHGQPPALRAPPTRDGRRPPTPTTAIHHSSPTARPLAGRTRDGVVAATDRRQGRRQRRERRQSAGEATRRGTGGQWPGRRQSTGTPAGSGGGAGARAGRGGGGRRRERRPAAGAAARRGGGDRRRRQKGGRAVTGGQG